MNKLKDLEFLIYVKSYNVFDQNHYYLIYVSLYNFIVRQVMYCIIHGDTQSSISSAQIGNW